MQLKGAIDEYFGVAFPKIYCSQKYQSDGLSNLRLKTEAKNKVLGDRFLLRALKVKLRSALVGGPLSLTY